LIAEKFARGFDEASTEACIRRRNEEPPVALPVFHLQPPKSVAVGSAEFALAYVIKAEAV
jgi:hypothetical protein